MYSVPLVHFCSTILHVPLVGLNMHMVEWGSNSCVGGSLLPRGFPPGTPVFPSPQKPTIPNSNSIWNPRATTRFVSRMTVRAKRHPR